VHSIGRRVNARWLELAAAAGLATTVAGLPALTTFSIDGRDAATVKTYIAQSLLAEGFLGATALFASIAHERSVLDPYLEALGSVLADVANRTDEELLATLPQGVSLTGFGRLA
jgi:glutamate-1-semialdehyde 2,1-aminomutase